MQRPSIDPTDRARRLGDVAAILIDLGRRARLAQLATEPGKDVKPAGATPIEGDKLNGGNDD